MTKYPANCEACPLFRRLNYFVPAVGPSSPIVIVGEAPGEWEVQLKTPFVGPSGKKLNSLLKRAEIERLDCRVTNVLKCRPDNNKLPEDLDTAISCCSSLLEEEIRGAKVILGLGNVPLYAFTGFTGITKRRGSVYEIGTGQPFVGTLHPSFLIRLSFMTQKEEREEKITPEEVVVADLKRVKKISEGAIWQMTKNYTIDPTQPELEQFLSRLNEPERLVGIDIETTKAPVLAVVPFTIAFSFRDWTVCLEFEDNLPWIFEALKSPTPKVFHNGIFDVSVLRNVGFEVVNWTFDTMYSHHLLYAELSHKLDFVQSIYTYLPFHKHMRDTFEEEWEK